MAEDLEVNDTVALIMVRDILMHKDYSYLVGSFRPAYYWWEAFDMTRKLVRHRPRLLHS